MTESQKQKIRDDIYRLMDSFLVEGDEPRSIDRLNMDRHLFVEEMESYLIQKVEEREREMVAKIRKLKYEGRNVYLNEAVDEVINSLTKEE